jgi:hypothetical protein
VLGQSEQLSSKGGSTSGGQNDDISPASSTTYNPLLACSSLTSLIGFDSGYCEWWREEGNGIISVQQGLYEAPPT